MTSFRHDADVLNVYALAPEERVACALCTSWEQPAAGDGRGEAVLAGADHPPYAATPTTSAWPTSGPML